LPGRFRPGQTRKLGAVRIGAGLLPQVLILVTLPWAVSSQAQESGIAFEQRSGGDVAQEEAEVNPRAPCLEPPPMVRWQDYDGKFKKSVGVLARKLERKSVPVPRRYEARKLLCTLEPKDKFLLFFRNTVDPGTVFTAAFNAGLDQAQNSDPSFHQGAAGYRRRFGADLADVASGSFFGDFMYPTIFGEDPRYYRLAHGTKGTRLLHALSHVFVAHNENGTHMVNVSQWLGSATAVVLSNTYHPDNQRGVGPAAQRVAYTATQNMGFDVLREFWPEIARKFKLPFRGQTALSINGKTQ
jgi:hypothetical protein